MSIDAANDLPKGDIKQEGSARIAALAQIAAATQAAFAADPNYACKPLSLLNKEAAALQRAGMPVEAVAAYSKLFRKAKEMNIIHGELYTCYSNRAAAYLQLCLWEEALADAEKARSLSEAALKVSRRSIPGFVKTYLRKGTALIGLKRFREAALVLEEGLRMDPFHPALKEQLDTATQGVVADLLQGKGLERRALPPPEQTQRISNHAFSAPLHKIKTEDLLPNKLLTPFQAESDHHVKDTYNYVTVQTDVKMPRRQIRYLQDTARHEPFQLAVQAAVRKLLAEDKDVRVLHIGAGAGLLAMAALRAGAFHVTAVERWLYLSLACKEAMAANKFDDASYSIVYKRPTDLALLKDVSICCNILVCDMFDEGLLTSGLIPSMRHAIQNLMTEEMIVLPAAATLYVQAAEVRTKQVCGIDMAPLNRHRWHPAYLSGTPLKEGMYTPLSDPVEAWHFDLRTPPEDLERKLLDLHFHTDGRMNAVIFWFRLQLVDGLEFSTGPEAVAAGLKTLGPAIQYLAGELPVEQGAVIPLLASHNTVHLRFDLEDADYLHLAKPDAAFPLQHFALATDAVKHQAFKGAIERAIRTRKRQDSEVHVLDMGCGTGFLSSCAAKAGADTVLACDLHHPMCDLTRQVAAANGQSAVVSVIQRDAGLLERGPGVRLLGMNLVVTDFFDAGFVGNNFLYLLDICKRKVLQPGCTVVPAGATLFCMGIEVLTPKADGFDFSCLDKYRWDKGYENCRLDDIPHKRLTAPAQVLDFRFDGMQRQQGRSNLLKLEVAEAGTLNAIAFWFDLHLDAECTITTAPEMIGVAADVGPEVSANLDASAAAASSNTSGGNPCEAETEGQEAAQSQPVSGPLTASSSSDGRLCSLSLQIDKREGHVSATIQPVPQDSSRDSVKPAEKSEAGQNGLRQNGSCEDTDTSPQASSSGSGGCRAEAYGQALQYLDRCLDVSPGNKVTILVKRDGSEIRFDLRQGVGEWVERAPWKMEWGGGASVENPHVQRVKYCELLVSDFLMRVKSRRFLSIEKDMKMVLAHCGSLLLDPAALCQVYHELVVLERMHTAPEFSPGVLLEAVTRPPLRYC